MSKKLFFVVSIDKQYIHATISVISFLRNIIEMVDNKIQSSQIIQIDNNQVKVEFDTSSEQDYFKIEDIVKQFGAILRKKIPMNDLFSNNQDNIMALKQMLDLVIVELQIFNNAENTDIKDIKTISANLFNQIGEMLERETV